MLTHPAWVYQPAGVVVWICLFELNKTLPLRQQQGGL
jgi:hypothetical protein